LSFAPTALARQSHSKPASTAATALSLLILARLAGNTGRFACKRWQVTGAVRA